MEACRLLRSAALFVVAAAYVSTCTGCAVVKATQAPDRKDLSVLAPGVPKSQVIRELGPPIQTKPVPGGTRDLYAFKQGYSMPTKMGRAAVHAGADAFSFGLWEFAATPMEEAFQGEDVRAEVLFNTDDRIQRVEYFEGGHLHEGGPTLARFMRRDSTERQLVIGEALPAEDSSSSTAAESGVQHASAADTGK